MHSPVKRLKEKVSEPVDRLTHAIDELRSRVTVLIIAIGAVLLMSLLRNA